MVSDDEDRYDRRYTHEDLPKNSAEAGKTKTKEPHSEGKYWESRVIFQGDETGSDIDIGFWVGEKQ